MNILGQLSAATNCTLLVEIDGIRHVYKPISGERPLWDFPSQTLANREVASFRVSQLLGWNIVPETKFVEGPEGLGSCQRWIEGESDCVDLFTSDAVPDGWFAVFSGVDSSGQPVSVAHSPNRDLNKIALFDAVINNADRKAGHIIRIQDDQVVGIDHGVTFHHEPKLRTVLWGWAFQQIPEDLIQDLNNFLTQADQWQLDALISQQEIEALASRTETLITTATMPGPNPDWPAVPWPIF